MTNFGSNVKRVLLNQDFNRENIRDGRGVLTFIAIEDLNIDCRVSGFWPSNTDILVYINRYYPIFCFGQHLLVLIYFLQELNHAILLLNGCKIPRKCLPKCLRCQYVKPSLENINSTSKKSKKHINFQIHVVSET